MLAVTVSDAGPGIPADDRDRIFQPFQRLHPEETPGSGIGLTLCRRIIDRHGGTIAAQDNAAGGTVMVFTLPLAEEGDGEGTSATSFGLAAAEGEA